MIQNILRSGFLGGARQTRPTPGPPVYSPILLAREAPLVPREDLLDGLNDTYVGWVVHPSRRSRTASDPSVPTRDGRLSPEAIFVLRDLFEGLARPSEVLNVSASFASASSAQLPIHRPFRSLNYI